VPAVKKESSEGTGFLKMQVVSSENTVEVQAFCERVVDPDA
jgi:hypothetical protein